MAEKPCIVTSDSYNEILPALIETERQVKELKEEVNQLRLKLEQEREEFRKVKLDLEREEDTARLYQQRNKALEQELEQLKIENRKFKKNEIFVEARRQADLEYKVQVEGLKQQLEQERAENDRWRNNSAYVAVLIDGDCTDYYTRTSIFDGESGGKEMASKLLNLIRSQHYLKQFDVVATIYANLTDLCRLKPKAEFSKDYGTSKLQFREFAQGFTGAKATFDFVDVGPGKERADSKIREMARWHLRNPNCKHVYLGICHDSGYASFLGLFKQDDTWRERVTLLSSGFVHSAIEATGLDRIDLQLPDRLPSSELTTITTLHRSSSHPLLDSLS
ncbi:uncharacterized protein CTHT_0006860 [Thermochaetoides thermophila DSM 1495]|uniref:DUF7923 domain-containing protein n=1 Tax=Chaetomium thermophilum (strain DSM 1495 / CBS 144.50 / IMI 039719) TaxID=759272 RepID=G0RYI9_CHATD|nr:hypothetical protein CTHT_0006860 [Thermochaetoides thermophila DSM 1495]EGS23975.1 hypothetical protein CTHT_0006860 [Thermochaetoides thermophila DSM 1495]